MALPLPNLLLIGLALAQVPVDVPPTPGFVPPEAAPVAPPAPVRLGPSTQWTAVGPVGGEGFVDVAIHPARAGIWVVSQRNGAVWVTTDGGSGWVEVLEGEANRFGRSSSDEDILLDVVARVDELVGSVDVASDITDPDALQEMEDVAGEAQSVTNDVAAGIQGELDQGLWFDDQTGRHYSGRARVRFTRGGVLMVARPDGLRVSPDLGATWVHVVEQPISDVAEVGPSEWLAVGALGAWVSTDLVQWSPTGLPMPEAPSDLVVDGGVWATGPSGVWLSRGGDWRALPSVAGVVYTVRPTAADARALVLGGRLGLTRAEPFDAPPDPTLGPAALVRDVERVRDDFLLAATSEGAFESADGGRSWTPLDRGLVDPRTHAIEVVGREVILVGATGVYRLDPLSAPVEEAPPPTAIPPFLSLNHLVGTSLSRRELTQRVGTRAVAALVPEVQLEYVYQTVQGPDWTNDDPGGTLFDYDGYWRLQARLTWAPNRQRTGTSFDAETLDDLQVAVIGDEVVVDGDEAPQVVYSMVSRGAAKYRSSLTTQITDLYRLRARLLLDAPPRNLLEAVLRDLRVAEVEASLDVLCEGAVASWRADPSNALRPDARSPAP